MNYVRKRKREPQDISGGSAPSPSNPSVVHPPSTQPANSAPRPQQPQPPAVKRKRPAMFGPGSGITGPPPESLSANTVNQLRLVETPEH